LFSVSSNPSHINAHMGTGVKSLFDIAAPSRRARSFNRGVLDEYLPRFFQLGQTSLRLIRVRRAGIFFDDLPIKFCGVRLVELLLFQLRGIV